MEECVFPLSAQSFKNSLCMMRAQAWSQPWCHQSSRVGLTQSPAESLFALSKIGTVTSPSQDRGGGVNEITHIKCPGQAWHTVNPQHMGESSL